MTLHIDIVPQYRGAEIKQGIAISLPRYLEYIYIYMYVSLGIYSNRKKMRLTMTIRTDHSITHEDTVANLWC